MGSFRDESNTLVRPANGGKFFSTSAVVVLGAMFEADKLVDSIGGSASPRRGGGVVFNNGDASLTGGLTFAAVSVLTGALIFLLNTVR